jgi:hypothetical protein
MSIFKRAARHDDSAEIARLRAELADRDRQLADLGRRVDDLLDRESMHVYDPNMERLATSAAIDRLGAPRESRPGCAAGRRASCDSAKGSRPDLKVLAGNVTELTITAPRIERGVWEGFER